MTIPRRTFLRAAAGALALPALPTFAFAQAWPSRPVRMIVGFGPGSAPDIVARLMGQWLSDSLGQPFLIENRPGAASNIGTEAVVRAAPDGYTVQMTVLTNVFNTTLYTNLKFSFGSDMAHVAGVANAPYVVVVPPSFPAKTVPEFIAYAKANPGKISYGTPGSGSSMHFAGESLKAIAGIFIVHIPYRGAAPAIADLLGGQVPMGIAGLPPVVGPHKAGKIHILAVTSTQRSGALPDIPAMAELPGFAGYNFTNWTGVFMAGKTPPAVIERLAAEIGKAVREPAMREKLLAAGVDPLGLPTPQFVQFLAREKDTYSKIAKARSIKADD